MGGFIGELYLNKAAEKKHRQPHSGEAEASPRPWCWAPVSDDVMDQLGTVLTQNAQQRYLQHNTCLKCSRIGGGRRDPQGWSVSQGCLAALGGDEGGTGGSLGAAAWRPACYWLQGRRGPACVRLFLPYPQSQAPCQEPHSWGRGILE